MLLVLTDYGVCPQVEFENFKCSLFNVGLNRSLVEFLLLGDHTYACDVSSSVGIEVSTGKGDISMAVVREALGHSFEFGYGSES